MWGVNTILRTKIQFYLYNYVGKKQFNFWQQLQLKYSDMFEWYLCDLATVLDVLSLHLCQAHLLLQHCQPAQHDLQRKVGLLCIFAVAVFQHVLYSTTCPWTQKGRTGWKNYSYFSSCSYAYFPANYNLAHPVCLGGQENCLGYFLSMLNHKLRFCKLFCGLLSVQSSVMK